MVSSALRVVSPILNLDFAAVCILAFAAGLPYSWGAFGLYLISYISYKGSEVKNAEAINVTVFSTAICCLSLGQLLGSYIHLGWKRFASFCGGCGLILSIVGFLLIPTVWSLIFFMGITLGISSGFLFYCALFSYLALHQREKGLATGMGACFFVLQKIVWTLVANKTVNPEDLEVNNHGLFPDSVAEKVSQLLRIIVYTTMCLLLVGACAGSPWFRYIISDNQRSGSDAATECIGLPPVNGKQQRHDSKSSDDDGLELGEEDELEVDPKQIVTVNSEPEAPFPWMPLFVLFLGYICVTNMTFLVGNYKLLGFIIGADTPGMTDHNLSVIGAFNSVSAVIARPVWGLLTDKMNYRALLLNAALATLLTVLFVESAKINIIFFGFVTVGVFFNAVSDPLWLPFCINYAGLIHGPKMYAFISLPSRFIRIFIQLGLSQVINSSYFVFLLALVALTGLVVLWGQNCHLRFVIKDQNIRETTDSSLVVTRVTL